MRDFAAVLVSVASVITALSLRFGTLNRGVRINGGIVFFLEDKVVEMAQKAL